MFRPVPDERAVMVQSADPVNYFEMLRLTARPNRDFCRRRKVRYACVQAVLYGFHPWQACYNRILFLHDLVAQGYGGWFLHLDADAYVHDRRFDIATYLDTHADRSFIIARGSGPEPWNVNDGVFFANCAHPDTQRIARLWMEGLDALPLERLRAAVEWVDQPDDQRLLHAVLRRQPALTDAFHYESAALINSPEASFTRQVLRAAERDPAQRVRRIARDVAQSLRRSGEPPDLLLPSLAAALKVPAPDIDAMGEAAAEPEALVAALRQLVAQWEQRQARQAEAAPTA
ncbi:hypothetical protein SAMN02745194_02594 [Roseomonas rosea]|uniref:Galactosyl transferase GMA12/MNN10 family protein n=1 Tax=Muricoccus roseus TaxID=198092 RepID=A0A1M6JET0_9PROT|nr:hypothetical protein [Roseomonas rosea]SHJ45201.1 hypothetical protein SAMN02745194_02594 [Roseomonas rosea]